MRSFDEILKEFEDFFQMDKSKNNQLKARDIFLDIEIDFLDAIRGITKPISYQRNEVCGECKGSKVKESGKILFCGECNATGMTDESPCKAC